MTQPFVPTSPPDPGDVPGAAEGEAEPVRRLEVRLLGGFEVRYEERPVDGFESQKVRALLAYLSCQPDRELSREQLADFFWPEASEEGGRRNLRQALYNLRNTLLSEAGDKLPLVTTQRAVRISGGEEYWCDVVAFTQALRRGRGAGRSIDANHLSGAIQLYRGDFLDGFLVKGSPAFEEWLTSERERHRDAVISCLQDLVDHYFSIRHYDLGVQYAWRWVNLDPLSEAAHGRLMRLYSLSGRRNRALAQYEDCRRLLSDELGVEPMESTNRLYEAILIQDQLTARRDADHTAYPCLSLAGRQRYVVLLQQSWQKVSGGGCRFTLVEGPAGIGKTHLVEHLLGLLRRQQRLNILRGRWGQHAAPDSYQPFEEALLSAILSQQGFVRRALADLSPDWLAELGRMIPEIPAQRPDLPKPPPVSLPERRQRLYEAVARLLEMLCAPYSEGRSAIPLILFLEDLHLAGRDTCQLLTSLRKRSIHAPLWIIATLQPGSSGPSGNDACGAAAALPAEVWDERIELDGLNGSDCRQLALQMLEGPEAEELSRLFERTSGGLPQTIQELANDLGERGRLVPTADDAWVWNRNSAGDGSEPVQTSLDDLIWRRFLRLPTSARRLLTLAAVVGHRFDAELLADVGDEHISVVRANLSLWMERRFARQVVEPWPEMERDPDPDPMTDTGGVHTPFEFAHERIRQVIYDNLHPSRRRAIHEQVANGLERRFNERPDAFCEALAYHFTAAQQWERAVFYREIAGDWAGRLPAPYRALFHYDRALELLEHLPANPAQTAERRARLEASRARMADARP